VREERIRVSRDLHDGVLQGLTGIRLEIHDIADAAASVPDLHDRLLAIERALAIEQRELRRLIENLNPKGPAASDGDTLDAVLRRRAERLSAEWQTPITTQVMPSGLRLPPENAQAVEFMCQEATINALKHAHPSRVTIAVAASDDEIRLTVVDDGRGFPFSGRLDHDALVARNLGPVTLRDRAASLHGRLSVESGRRGSRVEIMLPSGAAVAGSRIPDA
jgi:signal transduction histidine kinase